MIVIERSDIQGQHEVKLIQCQDEYCVVYGLQIKRFKRTGTIQALEQAIKEYNDCVIHQMGCAGYFDEDE